MEYLIIGHARELEQNKCWVIWGLGVLGCKLYQEIKNCALENVVLYDSDNQKIVDSKLRLTEKELLKKLKDEGETNIIITVENDNAVKEIAGRIYDWGGNFINIYRFVPENSACIRMRIEKEGIDRGDGERVSIVDDLQANRMIEEKVSGSLPFLISRWGSVEGNIVYGARSGLLLEGDIIALKNNAGVFPTDERVIEAFVRETTDAAESIDILCAGFWCLHLEEMYQWYSPNAILIHSKMMDPGWNNTLWTRCLKEKKVLVIHPFAKLIEQQYGRREKLFPYTDILPEFDLLTYPAVQSMGGNRAFSSWLEALQKMKKDIERINFDIALIGCGAYGMPIGAYIKNILHRQAIHMGGVLQILFGIKGKRWEQEGFMYQNSLYNEFWIRPTDDLRPMNYQNVEDGCYW